MPKIRPIINDAGIIILPGRNPAAGGLQIPPHNPMPSKRKTHYQAMKPSGRECFSSCTGARGISSTILLIFGSSHSSK